MKKIIISFAICLFSIGSYGFEIFALGTSNTNCKGAGQAYTNALNDMFAQEKINAQVINAGVDGDRPAFMMPRLEQGLKSYPDIKIVIFEPGPNERNPRLNLGSSEEILQYLQSIKMPTVFISNDLIQTPEEAKEFAQKNGVYYYGNWTKGVPRDREHRQYDMGSGGGHMTAQGCQLWAKNIFPLLKLVIKEGNIH